LKKHRFDVNGKINYIIIIINLGLTSSSGPKNQDPAAVGPAVIPTCPTGPNDAWSINQA